MQLARLVLLTMLGANAHGLGYPNLDLSSNQANQLNVTCSDMDCGKVIPDIQELDCETEQLADIDMSFMMLRDKLLSQGGEIQKFRLQRGDKG